MEQYERRRRARGYVNREMEGKREEERERGELFKLNGRGDVFDAKLMIIRDHDCLVK